MATPQAKHQLDRAPRPILKWAGGKQKLLPELLEKVPEKHGRYIEPFFGGGALFFALRPEDAVIADSNPELVNVYQVVANDVEALIEALQGFSTDEETYYQVRREPFENLDSVSAAARTMYLNRTCYNGLYRVNRKGQFNVPYGRYTNPRICNPERLRVASQVLQQTTIVCADYRQVLQEYARAGDFVFLDPPYLPVSRYSDFKRYTKEQFYEDDHCALAEEVQRLHKLGCYTLLTNSDHPLVHDLYKEFEIELVNTRRNISSKANKRTGVDVIVWIPARRRFTAKAIPDPIPEQALRYPSTRFMGSKGKLLPYILDVARQFQPNTVLDLFSGTGVVAYMFKANGNQVSMNDYMAMSSTFGLAMIENSHVTLSDEETNALLESPSTVDSFVSETFRGLYFPDEDNALIDIIRTNIKQLRSRYKQAIATSALIRACMKKRPRGIFTYVGHRYDDGRRDLQMSFEDQFRSAIDIINGAVFDNGYENKARHGDAMTIRAKPDLVYIDPPYYSPHSDNEYVRRYHFVEGLACNWKGVEMQWHTKTHKFKSYPTPFGSRAGAEEAFDKLFRKFRDSVLMVSYSSNSYPTREEIISLMSQHKRRVEVVDIDYRYSFANQGNRVNDIHNSVQEFLFVGF